MHDRGLPHGHPRRARRDQGPRQPRGPGRVRAREPPEGASRPWTPAGSTTRWRRSRSRDPKGRETVVDTDEGPRRDTTAEALARLRPVFDLPDGDDRGDATDGTVTAGNAPGITDGAAATVVASERAVERLGLKPLARIVGYAQAEVAPKWLFLAPVEGVRSAPRQHRAADRRLRPHRDQRGLRRADARRRPRARLRLGQGQRQRRRDRARPPDRRERGADRRDAAPRAPPPRGPLRPRHAVPRRRRLGRGGVRAGLTGCPAREATYGPPARRA